MFIDAIAADAVSRMLKAQAVPALLRYAKISTEPSVRSAIVPSAHATTDVTESLKHVGLGFLMPCAQGSSVSDTQSFFESVSTKFQGCLYRCACDDGFRMMEMTPGIEAMTGYPISDFLQNSVRTFASIIHPDDIGRVDEVAGRAVDQHTHWDLDYRLVARNGSIVRVHENGAAVYHADGRPQYLEGVIVDSTQIWAEREASDGWRQGLEAIMGHTSAITRILVGLKMLALNARIEAARAGNAGAGFSVVANEMKQMAAEAESVIGLIQKEKTTIDSKMAA
jgi:PAS domain S-box-containing protein